MFGLTRKKTLRAVERRLKACERDLGTAQARCRGLQETSQQHEAEISVLEHRREMAIRVAARAEEERDKAVRDFAALQALHAKRFRVGTFTVNPLRLTAQLRAIEPSLRVEYDGDKVVVYSDTVLKPEVARAVAGFLNGQWDRT